MNRYAQFKLILGIVCLLVLSIGCKQSNQDVYHAATFTAQGIQATIEIPAGTNAKVEFDPSLGDFKIDQKAGKDRIIDFLPYPGNYGFIPNTMMDKERGGDGDALDVLVICPRLETGTLINVIPIACLMLQDDDEIDTKIIAIPADSTLRVIQALDYRSFAVDYHAAKDIIQTWFLNYKGIGATTLLGWRDEKYAMAEVQKWALNKVKE